jgi:hypothetical protein
VDSYNNPQPGKTYISPSLDAFNQPGRKVRIATKVIEHPESYAFAEIKGEVVLRHKPDARSCIKAKFFEDDRGMFVLSIQGYTAATMKPHNASFTFIGDEIGKLVEFINHIQTMALPSASSARVTDAELRRLVLSRPQVQALLRDNDELFAEVLRNRLTREDVVAVGYRKGQLKVFEQLLNDEDFFRKKAEEKKRKDEALWQLFFERNPWIFGYGLSYVYLTGLDKKKLEQVVSGFSVAQAGKRTDGLLRTRGVISNLCFVEIKKHTTPLLETSPYRPACWAPSRELAGAVSQVQGTVTQATQELRKLTGRDDNGDPTGEEAYNYIPKAFVVIGSLEQFVSEHGINEEKHRSFELFRGNTSSPEIVTFDELYERARFIVQRHDSPGGAAELGKTQQP